MDRNFSEINKRACAPLGAFSRDAATLILLDDLPHVQGKLQRAKQRQRKARDKRKAWQSY